ncbi:MAG: peptidoglycan DD-metalloendopeptidase family protein, partial [Crocinitomicaceae bacterium]|nr:peptidoglycan DD-metalloendopeptidase family protein [Crocinitomicaceae bacterium]
LDVHLRRGQKVKAAFPGKVRYARYNSGGYGYLVIIRHYNGTETYYAHLSKLLVSSNQEVQAGEVIGLGGNTGSSSGPHLHFEIRLEDKAINPEKIFNLKTKCVVVNKLKLSKDIFSARGKVSSISSRTKFENSDKEGIFRHCDHAHHSLNKPTPTIPKISNLIIAKKTTELPKKNTASSKKKSSFNSQSKNPSTGLAKYHYTKKGDCIYSIARQHGVSTTSIYRYNNLSSKSVLRVNQKIRVK